MKRYLPFLLILVVALITAGAGLMLYRAKMPAHPRLAASGATRDKSDDSEGLHTLGPADAPATLEIYADFQCPPCASASPVIDKLHQDYGSRLRVVYREFPLEIHAYSIPAAMAAEAAGAQGHFWEMHDLLYRGQRIWSKIPEPSRMFSAYAASLRLDLERFNRDAKSGEMKARVVTERDAGAARGVKSTPTMFLNGSELRPPFTQKNLQEAIEAAISAPKKS